MEKDKLDEKCRAILESSKKLSEEEFLYLRSHMHRVEGVKDFGDVLRGFTTFYIPDPKGYCTIYYSTEAIPDWTSNSDEIAALFDANDYDEVTRMILERRRFFYFCGVANHRLITAYYRQYAYPRNYEMVFHDLSYWKTFSTFQALEQDFKQHGIPYFLEDPMNDPEFRAIIKRGKMMCVNDYQVFLSHCNYIDYDNPHRDGVNGRLSFDYVIERPYDSTHNERISIIMDSIEVEPEIGNKQVCFCHGGFRYEDANGRVITDYDRAEQPITGFEATIYSPEQIY